VTINDKEIKHKVLIAQMRADNDYQSVGASNNIYDKETQPQEYMAYAWRMHDHLLKENESFLQELNAGV